ncbi:MAG: hypothetical protein HY888_00120 [Deltaproteobacteria bacterium]|nr:hypothetical protein [Deltaproteobacteria bacterium]
MNVHFHFRQYLPVLIFLLALSPFSASAIPTINCHCFRERSYDPARPAVADPYILATTQNSFFATVFNVDKKTVVMKKQGGTSADDMWVAYWLASRYGLSAENLLQAKRPGGVWRDAVASTGITTKAFEDRFSVELNAGASGVRLAQEVVDGLLVGYKLIGVGELAEMRKGGATSQELIVAVLITGKTGQSPLKLHSEVKKGLKSWGTALNEAKIDTPRIQAEVAALLRKK